MEYTKTFNELKTFFSSGKEEICIPGSDIKIYNIEFRSDVPVNGFSNKSDNLVPENQCFTYPVFAPPKNTSGNVILLLHGLNERSWVKYLTWAYWLSMNTGSYVILFPISFHMNRSPATWKDPRAMISFMKDRNTSNGEILMSSFANVALSNRLTDDPLRFFNSGYQTTSDITKLMMSVRNGEHPVIPSTDKVNIFAYSIGAFLAEIILMGNPEKLFTDSKLFIFCGGSVFSNMQGSSKLIMDSLAFNKVYSYYMNDFEKNITTRNSLFDFFNSSPLGMAFRSMIDFSRLKAFRENILKMLKGQIQTVTLEKDTVIPAHGVVKTLSKWNTTVSKTVEVWDFPYPYSHENPFPVFDSPLSRQVDLCFERVFRQASAFLT